MPLLRGAPALPFPVFSALGHLILVESLELFLLAAPMLLLAMVAHEYAHGWAARSQGDRTAEQLGRLSWNPLRHIDPFLTILMPAMLYFYTGMLFGGAKPVPVDPRNYRQLKRGDIIVSMAGIVTNVGLGAILLLAVLAIGILGRLAPGPQVFFALLQQMFLLGILVNLQLAVFNLFPLPPLDGSHVFKWVLPPAWRLQYVRLGGVGLLVLLLLVTVARPVFAIWMTPVWWVFDLVKRTASPFLLASPFA